MPSASTSEPWSSGPQPRQIEIPAERFAGWLERFAAQHGPVAVEAGADVVSYIAADGVVAQAAVPLPPLRDADLLAHLRRRRRVGLLLVRLGGAAVGVAELPAARLTAGKVVRRHVQGRSAAGGRSQQRYARRREGQARGLYAAAADAAADVLLHERLDAVVTGGNRAAVQAVLDDPRLQPLRGLVAARLLDVPDPRQEVLEAAVRRVTAVRVRLSAR